MFLFGKEVTKCELPIEQEEDLIAITFTGDGFLIWPHRMGEILLRDFLCQSQ